MSMRAHVRLVHKDGTVLLDEDMNDLGIEKGVLRWKSWEPGHKSTPAEGAISLYDCIQLELTPCSDRLKREEASA